MIDDDDDSTIERSQTDMLASHMSTLGFRPKEPRAADTLEYFKTYSDPSGRVGRAVVVINKDKVGLEPTNPAYFIVTVQFHSTATEADIIKNIPQFCRPDVLRILSHFDEVDDRQEAEIISCDLCDQATAEYTERKDGTRICPDCQRRKGL